VASVRLGDLDDRLAPTPAELVFGMAVSGGSGDDQLAGGLSGDRLWGGDGNDVLYGAAGSDTLNGGGGSDRLYGQSGADFLIDGDRDGATGSGGPGPDLLDGGGGDDTLRYWRRTAAVVVDLADTLPDGEPGENDVLVGIDNVIGGRSDDRLAGNARGNFLDGGRGSDLLSGRGGRDFLFGAHGSDLISGGRGNDLVSGDNGLDRLNAGPGNDELQDGGGPVACGGDADRVRDPGSHDHLMPDCERVVFPDHSSNEGTLRFSAYPAAASTGSVGYRLTCPLGYNGIEYSRDPCSARVRLRESGRLRRLLGIGTLPTGRWRADLITAPLSTLGRRLAGRHHGVWTTVTVAGYHIGPRVRWTIRLKVPANTGKPAASDRP
jgi:hypothetical protein